MPNGFGVGRGMGRGFGGGRGGGRGFGFRGGPPPWPYVGRGRGGLSRCGYYGAGAPAAEPYPEPPHPFHGAPPPPDYPPFTPPHTREEELGFLKDQAAAIKEQLEEIAERIRRLEGEAPEATE